MHEIKKKKATMLQARYSFWCIKFTARLWRNVYITFFWHFHAGILVLFKNYASFFCFSVKLWEINVLFLIIEAITNVLCMQHGEHKENDEYGRKRNYLEVKKKMLRRTSRVLGDYYSSLYAFYNNREESRRKSSSTRWEGFCYL